MSERKLRVFEGDLYREGEYKVPVRKRYEWHFARPEHPREVAACLRAGSVTSLGGYPLYFISEDGAPLCFKCVRKEWRQVVATQWGYDAGWNIVACEVNWEDGECNCAHCDEKIPAAYV